MNILLADNTVFDMNNLPELVDDLHYCVLDYSDTKDVDFKWVPLIFLDEFPTASVDLKIGPYRIQMPLNWSIVIGDKNLGHMEIIELKQLNDRDFDVFTFNPISGFRPEFHEITIENIFPDVTWNMPKLKHGHILAVPLTSSPKPLCAFFLRDINKISESLDITKIFT